MFRILLYFYLVSISKYLFNPYILISYAFISYIFKIPQNIHTVKYVTLIPLLFFCFYDDALATTFIGTLINLFIKRLLKN